MPGFKVNMGFGMHIGWAIEGPIGSYFKIDASYLSPHVNITARLEAATWQYGIPLLISGSLYDLCTKKFKTLFRCIDIVTVKGSNVPMRFFTMNLNMDLFKEVDWDMKILGTNSDEKKSNWKKQKEDIQTKIFEGIQSVYDMLTTDHEFVIMR